MLFRGGKETLDVAGVRKTCRKVVPRDDRMLKLK
jgi:hypothetical protein